MKKLMMSLLLIAFCWSAFAIESPQQDTTRRHQDTVKKHPMKSKKKSPKNSTKKDTIKSKTVDTMIKVPPVM